jgi:hypothetical protein
LSRLRRGEVILGDGSYVVTLEKRGYVKAGDWTPEASVEVKILLLLFSRFVNFIYKGTRRGKNVGDRICEGWS